MQPNELYWTADSAAQGKNPPYLTTALNYALQV
jgi:hypothetical protein